MADRMATMASIEIKNFSAPDERRPFEGKGYADVVNVAGKVVGKGVFEPGWRWSANVKPIAGTDSCQVSHLGYVISGRMKVYLDDGTEGDAGPGEEVVQCELSDKAAVLRLVEGVDVVAHFGGISLETSFDPILQSNIVGVFNLYEAVRRHGVKRVARHSRPLRDRARHDHPLHRFPVSRS